MNSTHFKQWQKHMGIKTQKPMKINPHQKKHTQKHTIKSLIRNMQLSWNEGILQTKSYEKNIKITSLLVKNSKKSYEKIRRAFENAGGYSFKRDVCKSPLSEVPIAQMRWSRGVGFLHLSDATKFAFAHSSAPWDCWIQPTSGHPKRSFAKNSKNHYEKKSLQALQVASFPDSRWALEKNPLIGFLEKYWEIP